MITLSSQTLRKRLNLPNLSIPLVFVLTLLISLLPAASQSIAAQAPQVSNPDARYQQAKDYYYKLERDDVFGEERSNWLAGIRKFRRIYLEQPKGKLAPSCLYMMGRMQYKMYQRFNLPIDLEDAISYYKDVATIFPKNNLADDAYFNIGEIYLDNDQQFQMAADQFKRIVKDYPDGDRYAQAVNKLRRLESDHNIPVPENFVQDQKLSKLIKVLPVKYWSSKDYTRIVIRATDPVHFTSDLLEKTEGKPRRLYIDFDQSYIPVKFRKPIPIRDGLLQQVRTGQFSDNVVRVVLDMESVSDYSIFSLNDPFRVIVDVHGTKEGEQEMAAEKEESDEPPELESVAKQLPKEQPVAPPAPEVATARPGAHPFITLRDFKKNQVGAGDGLGDETHIPSEGTYSLAQQLGLGVRKIIIDPGHGGKDPGAMAFGLKEKDIVLSIAKKVAQILSTTYGYEVELTRSQDTFLPLEERTAIANTENADLFVSIHINAHPNESVKGIETYYLNLATNAEAMRVAAFENATSTHNISELQDILSTLMQNSKIKESARLAQQVHTKMVGGLKPLYPVRDLGVKQAPFYVLLGAEMPAILCEIAFITNKQEAELLQSQQYQMTAAQKISSGIVTYIDSRTTASLQ